MALTVCKDCTCAYSVGAPKCPQCGSKKGVEQGSKGDPTLDSGLVVAVGAESEGTADA